MVFGSSSGFPPVLDVFTLNGANAFKMLGEPGCINALETGLRVAGVGDVNNDGLTDIAIGSRNARKPIPQISGPGVTYIVFGNSVFPAVLELSALNGANGFAIKGDPPPWTNEQFGFLVSGAAIRMGFQQQLH